MTSTAERTARPDTAHAVLAAARERRGAADAAEADLLELAVDWAAMHSTDSLRAGSVQTTHTLPAFGETDLPLAGPGAPHVAEFCVAEFAVAIGLSHEAGKHYLGEGIELRYRLPRLWLRVTSGDLPAWRARRVARETMRLSVEAAAYVDGHVAPVAHKVRPSQLDRLVAEAIGRFMPEEIERIARESWDKRHVTLFEQLVSFTGTMHVEADLDIADALDLEAAVVAGAEQRASLGSAEPLDVRRAQAVGDLARRQLALDLAREQDGPPRSGHRPRQVVLHVHLSQAALDGLDPIARLERAQSLVAVEQVRTWCGTPGTQVVVKPVIDLAGCSRVDQYEIPDRMHEQVALRDGSCVFPWCSRPARRCHPDDNACDTDHVLSHARGGVTCPCNLAPLCRRHHRLKTHGSWRYLVLEPGRYLWTSPHGYRFLRDHTGTADVVANIPAHITGDIRTSARPPDF